MALLTNLKVCSTNNTLLESHAGGEGVTTLVATHDSEIVNDLRRRVIRMEAGSVLADEPVGVFSTT